MTTLYERIIDNNSKYVEIACLSSESESLPTTGIATGSLAHVVDSAIIQAFNATAGEWVTQIELCGSSETPAATLSANPSLQMVRPIVPTLQVDEPEEEQSDIEPDGEER